KITPRAERVQFVLAGIAKKIGGDHTQDLSRLLRLPCTMNRKDERNGKTPLPCELVECDPSRRYAFGEFEHFADAAPEQVEAREAAKMKLPKGCLTQGRQNRLNDLINLCAAAEVGERSGHDFRLCCWAIEQGLDREKIWPEVQEVGKFKERGRQYFDLTW